jgi:hypothetical protein
MQQFAGENIVKFIIILRFKKNVKYTKNYGMD